MCCLAMSCGAALYMIDIPEGAGVPLSRHKSAEIIVAPSYYPSQACRLTRLLYFMILTFRRWFQQNIITRLFHGCHMSCH